MLRRRRAVTSVALRGRLALSPHLPKRSGDGGVASKGGLGGQMDRAFFTEGHNCWRITRADRFALLIDGQDYFRALRATLMQARDQVMMVGWDFDFDIEMVPGEGDADGLAPDGLPNRVGPFLEALIERRPTLDIHMLKWSGGALIAPGSMTSMLRAKFMTPTQLHVALDGCHPIGACHHQKLVVVDDAIAFCGGIDVTAGRWDTPEHRRDDPRRVSPGGDVLHPWHDASSVLTGPAAQAAGDLARRRWATACGKELCPPVAGGGDYWPGFVTPDFTDAELAISRTEPPQADRPIIAEIEALYFDMIAAAQDCIYLESQYFASPGIADRLAARLQEPDGPEVIVINPASAESEIEDTAMHIRRDEIVADLARRDPHGRFRIRSPRNASGQDIYVHSKLMIVDDCLLRVGSSNLDRRSMGFDTEADLALRLTDAEDRARVRALRNRLLAEHLGIAPEVLSAQLDGDRGLVAAIDAADGGTGRGLYPLAPRNPGPLRRMLAHSLILDPRYRRSAQARLGITGRHLLIGAAAVGLGLYLLRRSRARDEG